jgi:hypothetical protein
MQEATHLLSQWKEVWTNDPTPEQKENRVRIRRRLYDAVDGPHEDRKNIAMELIPLPTGPSKLREQERCQMKNWFARKANPAKLREIEIKSRRKAIEQIGGIEKWREKEKSRYWADRPRVLEVKRSWARSNMNKVREKARRYRIRHQNKDRARCRVFMSAYRKTDKFAKWMHTYKIGEKYKWTTLRTSAKSKGLPVTITFAQAVQLFRSDCYYCGHEAPMAGYGYRVDRLDNSKGYEPGNVVACCKPCNFAKCTDTPAEFIRKCHRVASFYPLLTQPSSVRKVGYVRPYAAFLASSANRGIAVSISESTYQSLVVKDCTYCGAPPVGTNGLDRVDNELGYEHGNVVPCCSDCNYLKGSLPLGKFIRLVKRVATKWPK